MHRGNFIALSSAALVAAPLCASASPATLDLRFASSFWVNLHHRLYGEASALAASKKFPRLGPNDHALLTDLRAVPASSMSDWSSAVGVYATTYISKDLLFDQSMSDLFLHLAQADATRDLKQIDIPADIREALTKAAPIYRTFGWPADDQMNGAWIANARALLAKHQEACVARLASLYGIAWLATPYQMEVCSYANWATAYTENYPNVTLTAIGTANNTNAGTSALEVVLHEAAHSVVFDETGSIGGKIVDISKSLDRKPPNGLWHAIMFYTTGRVVGDAYADEGIAYTPYADQVGLFTRAWPTFKPALTTHWEQHILGKASIDDALVATIRAIPG